MKSAIWLVSDYSKVQGVYLQSAEGKGRVPITWHLFVAITRQLILTLVPIVCFVEIQTRIMAENDGYELILIRIFNFQLMPSMSWKHAIKGMTHGPDVSMQELNIFKTSMPRFMFTIFAGTKNRASIHAWCWHEKKKVESWTQSWYTESRHWIRWCYF